MSLQDGTTPFKLSRPLKYKQGGDRETTEIELHEPGMEHAKFYLRLKQMLTQSQMEIAKDREQIEDIAGDVVKPIHEQEDDSVSELEGMSSALALMLNASQTVDVAQFLSTFEKMVLMPLEGMARPVCKLAPDCNMTRPLWNRLHPEDAFNMAVRWCAFFAMPSTEGEKTSSEPQPDSQPELTVA